MKFNFKKISAIATSALLTGMTLGVAAAASFPSPYVNNGSADGTVIVTGSGAAVSDVTAAGSIKTYLASKVTGTSSPDGDSVLIAGTSDNLNLGDTWSVLTGTVDDDDLSTLLADGTYMADDNDEFDYEQKIVLGAPTLSHFRDSDYENQVGLSEKTPVLGFKLSSNTFVMNYTLDFTQDAESDIVSGDLDDIEGSDITLLGKTYYVSDLKNGTDATYLGKLTLLDSASVATVSEGETVTANGKSVSIEYIDSDEVVFNVDGERAPSSGKLTKGGSYKLNDGSYIGARDISKLEVSGESGSASFSIGSGKLEITSGSDIKLNDDTVSGVKGYVFRGTASSGAEKIDKIRIGWTTDEEVFLTPEAELVMPGFEAVKFTMNEMVRPEDEKITVEKDGDTSIQLTAPIKDGEVSLNILYSNASGDFVGIGKASDDRLATSSGTTLVFQEKDGSGNDYHSYFVATYNNSKDAESYLLRAKVTTDTDNNRNETTIEKKSDGSWTTVCEEKAAADTCDIGSVSLTVTTIEYTSGGGENVTFTAGTNVVFNTLYTAGGLKVYLPYEGVLANNSITAKGAINVTEGYSNSTGHNTDSFYLFFDPENKDDDLAAGTSFNLTLNENSDDNLQVQYVNGAGTGSSAGLEMGETSTYEAYLAGDVSTKVLHYTNPDEDYAELYYPSGDSEVYAKVYLTEAGATSGASLGDIILKDTEAWQSSNAIIVGGSCINSAAAAALGVEANTCTEAFTAATGIGEGKYLIQTVELASGKTATVVAGYSAADTTAAVTRLTEQPTTITTTVGDKWVGTVSAEGTSTVTKI